jgi:hypothetical protein
LKTNHLATLLPRLCSRFHFSAISSFYNSANFLPRFGQVENCHYEWLAKGAAKERKKDISFFSHNFFSHFFMPQIPFISLHSGRQLLIDWNKLSSDPWPANYRRY